MNELFVQSWFAFFCFWSMDELVVQSWPLFFGQWMNFSYSHDFFCVCQWKNFSRNQYYCFVLSNNELLVQSWHFCLVNEWTCRAIMTLLLLLCWWMTDLSVQSLPFFVCQWMNFSCNHDFVFCFCFLSMNELFVQSWHWFVKWLTFRAIMTFLLCVFWSMNELFVQSWFRCFVCCLVNVWTLCAIMTFVLSKNDIFVQSCFLLCLFRAWGG